MLKRTSRDGGQLAVLSNRYLCVGEWLWQQSTISLTAQSNSKSKLKLKYPYSQSQSLTVQCSICGLLKRIIIKLFSFVCICNVNDVVVHFDFNDRLHAHALHIAFGLNVYTFVNCIVWYNYIEHRSFNWLCARRYIDTVWSNRRIK